MDLQKLFDLNGQKALITGAARGIGKSMALALAGAGADVVLILRNTHQKETANAIEALGRQCWIFECDLGEKDCVKKAVADILAAHRIDILVNAAGIMRRSPASEYDDEIYDEVMQVNIATPFVLCREVGKYWIANQISGRIINVASLASFQGGINMAGYAVSKGGIAMLTKSLSNEWAAHGVRVNAIAPGYIATDMNIDTRTNMDSTYYNSITQRIPSGRWGSPDDFQGIVIFLASRASSYMTGQILTVDGGWMAR
ncbi:Hypothetical protein R9X50_00451800 [Acrodontium crateriforme]|uniref:2-deoxy-D-gluconate 3-dehydrogenase n=1 Tax=Acrodontium crateriforme TaxID=150365 RepID=A0AAQ3MB40_9PEZI|nr:Hypothetical protein R9X50_00451800 [Acrodontium crateriforme]